MSALSDIEAAHERHRAALLAREAAEQRRLVASYAKAVREIEGKLAKLAVEIASATENLDPGEVEAALRGKRVAQARLKGVLDDMRYEIAKWTDSITPEIEALHADAVRRGIESAETLTRLGMAPPPPGSENLIGQAFASVNHGAVEQAVAYSHGGPVRELLASLAGEAAEEVAQEMTSAIARGQNPLVTARRVRSALSTPLYRAQTITRTETLRAYREATRETYQQSNVVDSWVWVAACDSRTCGACWALHGETFPTSEKMGTHPRCRCTMAPNTKPWSELTNLRQPGVQETNLAANMETGPELFAKLPESQQLAILGPSKFAAYTDGRISLSDLVQVDESSVWGTTRREKSLRAIIGDDEAKAYARMARQIPEARAEGVAGEFLTGDEVSPGWEVKKGRYGTDADLAALDDQADNLYETLGITDKPGEVTLTTKGQIGGADGRHEYRQNRAGEHFPLPGTNNRYGAIRLASENGPDEIAAVYAHEFGHWIDKSYADTWGWYRMADDDLKRLLTSPRAVAHAPARRDLLSAIDSTDAAKILAGEGRAAVTALREAGHRGAATHLSKFLKYLEGDAEQIARAFEQYVGTHPGTPAYLREAFAKRLALNAAQGAKFSHGYAMEELGDVGLRGSYWGEEEFRKIVAPAIEKWLEAMGIPIRRPYR